MAVNWDPHRFLPPHAEAFIDELVAYTHPAYPGHRYARRVPVPPRSTRLTAEAP
jgi:hypothetical protein